MRVLLFTGKGGVGKTTTAAATAVHAARLGTKTLVLSADAAHSLQDVLGVELSGEPTDVEPGLSVMHIDPHARAHRSWTVVQDHLSRLVDAAGADPELAEEITAVPGAEDVLTLLELRDQVRSGPWDLLVVDCPATAETLRLVALPEMLRWCIARALPVETRIARALRPVLDPATGAPAPDDVLVDTVQRLDAELAEVRSVLTDPATSVRLVLTPEAVVVAEARRAVTRLALYGHRVDGVIANRVVRAGQDPWRSAWAARHEERLSEIRESFSPTPVSLAPYLETEPVGPDALADLGRVLCADDDPSELLQPPGAPPLIAVERSGDEFVLELGLPLAERRDVDLSRRGDELVVAIGGHRRYLSLPSALRRCVVVGASLRSGRLRVRFEPDPAVWRPL